MVYKQNSIEEEKETEKIIDKLKDKTNKNKIDWEEATQEEPKKTMSDYMAEFMVDSGARYIALSIVLGFFVGALGAGIFIGWLIWG